MKVLKLLIAGLLVFCLVACNQQKKETTAAAPAPAQKTETAAPAPEQKAETAAPAPAQNAENAVTSEKPHMVTIGTGGITGVYYATGGAIARILAKNEKNHKIRATPEATGASVFNINAISKGDMDFGIAQSDHQYNAVNGLGEWKDKPQTDIMAVFSLAPEAVALVVSEDSGIKQLSDLKGKKINIGNPGSGTRQNAIDILTVAGIDYEKDLKAESIKAADAPKMMQDGRIDGFFYTVGHPNGAIKEATAGMHKARLIDITGMESVISKTPGYFESKIVKSSYPESLNENDTITIGLLATLITNKKTPEDVVYNLTKEIFENLEELKTLHPVLATLTKEGMVQGNTAPFHPGALKYFKEVGLIQ